MDQLLEREQHEKKPHSPTVSEVPTVSPEVAQEEAERVLTYILESCVQLVSCFDSVPAWLSLS